MAEGCFCALVEHLGLEVIDLVRLLGVFEDSDYILNSLNWTSTCIGLELNDSTETYAVGKALAMGEDFFSSKILKVGFLFSSSL